MKLLPFIVLLTAILPGVYSVNVGWDYEYDDKHTNFATTACSTMLAQGYVEFDDLPSFPHIGGKSTILLDPLECGSCWGLTYTKGDNTTNTIYVTAVDSARDGWIIAQTALRDLAGQQAVDKGEIKATEKRVAGRYCGFK